MEFEINLKNTRIRSYHLLTVFIVLINCSYFIYQLFNRQTRDAGLYALGPLAAYVIYRYWITWKKGKPFRLDEWVYFALMLIWIDNYFFAILNLVLMLLYTAATQPVSFVFAEVVKQKNFPWKKYQWNQFSNVIIKDAILTIDFKNNKVIQEEVDGEVNEAGFNSFAVKCLKSQVYLNTISK